MTRTRKVAVVILTFGVLLIFVAYCVNDVVERDRRAELQNELLSANQLNRPLVIANVKLELADIERDERFGGGVAAVGFLIGIVGGVMLIIGGPTRRQ